LTDDAFPVVIIGGGLAGLVAGVHLAERGIQPLILEADSLWPGGRLSGGDPETFTYAGKTWSFKPDHGVHAVWGGYVNLKSVIQQFTETQLVPSKGEVWINRWGREVRRVEAGNVIRNSWLPAPFHYLQLLLRPTFWRTIIPLDFLSLPGFLFSIFATLGFDPIKEQRSVEQLRLNDYFRGWTPNLRATFKGLAANLLAAPVNTISWSAFIAALRFYTVLRRDSWQMSFFPSDSHSSLIQPLIEAVEVRSGEVRYGCTAIRLEQNNGLWSISVEDSAFGGQKKVFAKHVIIATNAPAAQRLLEASPDLDTVVKDYSFPAALRNVTVRIWFKSTPNIESTSGMFTGDFLPDNFFWLHQMYDDYRLWHSETGGSAIEVHIYGAASVLDMPDQNLLIECVTELQRAHPELKDQFVYGTVRRNSKVHTEFRVPDESTPNVNPPISNVHMCGDWIRYDTPALWMERSTVTGIAAANSILRAKGKTTFELLAPPPPGLFVQLLTLIARLLRLVVTPIFWSLRTVSGMMRTT